MARPVPPEAELARVMTHPLRPRILAFMTLRGESSPNQIATELGEPIGRVSYHTRLLRDAGWIELVRTVPRRGAVEHFYRAAERSFLDEEQWERLPVSLRRRLADMTVGQILMSAVEAAQEGGFDRPEAHVDRMQLELDERGWAELSELLNGVLNQATRIQERSNERRSSGDADAVRSSHLAILHFAGKPGPF